VNPMDEAKLLEKLRLIEALHAGAETLRAYLADVTERVVAQVIHEDTSEAEEREEPRQLTFTTR